MPAVKSFLTILFRLMALAVLQIRVANYIAIGSHLLPAILNEIAAQMDELS